ncbi:MAG: hypothetical protein C0492_00875 [Verminephrobacter sp.]|nr:hypothetical protein [Verminephrobacter sp.]
MEQARVTSPHGQQVAHANRGKPAGQAKDSLADAQGGAAPGGFMALLAALGDGSAPEALVPQVAAEDPLATEAASSDVAAQAVSQGGLLSWQWAAAMAGGAAQGVAGQGALAAKVADAAGGAAVGAGLSASSLATLIPSDGPLREGSLLLQTALQDAAVADDERGMAGDVQGIVSAAGKRKMPGRLGGGSAQAGDVTSAPGAQSLGVVGAKGQGAPTVPGAVPQPLVAERRDMGGARDGSRPLEFGVDGVPVALAPFVSEAAVGGRVLARGAESGPAVSGTGGSAEVSQESPMGLAGEAGTAVTDPAMVGAEDAVAEQVAYWVHQNIQNARMTVKHDGQPVEVSVSLTGNEAHVAFGSDEVQTRELLDGSVAQLRDMLRQEGLVLSGVTVGESGRRQGDEGASSGNPKNAPRQAQVVVPAVDVQAAGRARVQGDRAVDIFV